jgi:hypothetical protein
MEKRRRVVETGLRKEKQSCIFVWYLTTSNAPSVSCFTVRQFATIKILIEQRL